MILGLGANEPRVPLERTEFVRSDQKYSILSRIVRATQVDTIVHTFLETNSVNVATRALHEINVIGTLNLLAAAGSAGSSVRQVVVKSSTHIYGSAETDPAWFREEDTRTAPVRTRVERSLIEVESLVRDFTEDNPHLVVSVLRFANVLGTDIITPVSYNLRRRLLPCIAGFDPLVQFIEEDDVVRALEYVTRHRIPGVFNVAGSGKLPWSEVASICNGYLLPLPPFRPRAFVAPLRRIGPRAVPTGDGRPDPLRPGRRHLPPDRRPDSTIATPVPGAVESFARANNLRRAHRYGRARCTGTNRMSSSSSATPRPWSEASTPDPPGPACVIAAGCRSLGVRRGLHDELVAEHRRPDGEYEVIGQPQPWALPPSTPSASRGSPTGSSRRTVKP